MNIKHILKGWLKGLGLLRTTTPEQLVSEARLRICGGCTFSHTSRMLSILNGNEIWENSLICEKCGCPCLEKSLVTEEKCPLGKWQK